MVSGGIPPGGSLPGAMSRAYAALVRSIAGAMGGDGPGAAADASPARDIAAARGATASGLIDTGETARPAAPVPEADGARSGGTTPGGAASHSLIGLRAPLLHQAQTDADADADTNPATVAADGRASPETDRARNPSSGRPLPHASLQTPEPESAGRPDTARDEARSQAGTTPAPGGTAGSARPGSADAWEAPLRAATASGGSDGAGTSERPRALPDTARTAAASPADTWAAGTRNAGFDISSRGMSDIDPAGNEMPRIGSSGIGQFVTDPAASRSSMELVIVNAAMIPGWPAPRPFEMPRHVGAREGQRIPVAGQPVKPESVAARKERDEAEIQTYLANMGVRRSLLERIRASLRPARNRLRVLFGLAVLATQVVFTLHTVLSELDRAEDGEDDILNDPGDQQRRLRG